MEGLKEEIYLSEVLAPAPALVVQTAGLVEQARLACNRLAAVPSWASAAAWDIFLIV